MKIYRGPKTSNRWSKTDAKSLRTWASGWIPGKVVPVDGTIQKAGQRHTDLGIEIESRDIVALHKALLQYQTRTLSQLEKENAALLATVNQLEDVLRKINSLASHRRDEAPSLEILTNTIAKIADHFAWSVSRRTPLKLNSRWVKWKLS